VVITVPPAPARFRGLQILSTLLGLVVRLWWWRLTRRFDPTRAGAATRQRLERLGGMWIKVGQLISLRVDLFSNEFCAELSRLQDQAHGFSPAEARAIIEEELGGPAERFFVELDPHPFAAASTAQVHRARLHGNGVEVAVKVQRPGFADSVSREMKLVGRLVWLLEIFGIASYLRWGEMHKELQQIMMEEVDYRYEASNIKRIGRLLKKHRVRIPELFGDVCTRRLLVTELLRGVLMSDYIHVLTRDAARLAAWRTENGVDPVRVGRRLIFSLLRQIFEDNLYHGDLHPGNIMLLRDSRIALIDLGAVGFTDNEFLGRYRLFLRSVGELDFAKAVDALLLLGDVVPVENLNRIRTELIRTLRNWSLRTHVDDLPFHERSISTVSTALIQILAAGKVTPNWSFLRIRRAEQTLDASIVHLVPNTNYSKIAKRYFRHYDWRRVERFVSHAPARLAGGTVAAVELVHNTFEQTLFTASVVRHDALALDLSMSRLAYFAKVMLTQLVLGLSLLGVVIVAVFLHQHPILGLHVPTAAFPRLFERAPKLGRFGWLVALFFDLYSLRMIWRLRSRLSENDGRMVIPWKER
jgi:ubiquinone biosynthesis protein